MNMPALSIFLVVGAWLLPIARLWASWRKNPAPGHGWLVATLFGFALFSTSVQDGTTDLMAQFIGRGGVYALCSLVGLLTVVALLHYLQIHQSTKFATRSRPIVGLQVLYRILLAFWPVAALVIFLVEGLWFRGWIDVQGLKPYAIMLDQGPLVVSRLIALGYWIAGLWVGVIYPFIYLVWHRSRLDPAFRAQGGHWRLLCLAVTTFITVISGTVHVSATVLGYLQPMWSTTLHTVADTVSTINGPILVLGVLIGCLPQRVFWGMQSYYLYHQLLPLHTRLRRVVAGVYLDVPAPKLWDMLTSPTKSIIAFNRFRAEITDARFVCYGSSDTIDHIVPAESPLVWRHHLLKTAQREQCILNMIERHEACPAGANVLNAPVYQSLDYYLVLTQMVSRDNGDCSQPPEYEDQFYEHANLSVA